MEKLSDKKRPVSGFKIGDKFEGEVIKGGNPGRDMIDDLMMNHLMEPKKE